MLDLFFIEKGVMFWQMCRQYPPLEDKSSPLFSVTSNFSMIH